MNSGNNLIYTTSSEGADASCCFGLSRKDPRSFASGTLGVDTAASMDALHPRPSLGVLLLVFTSVVLKRELSVTWFCLHVSR
jgi:hypothetical protein